MDLVKHTFLVSGGASGLGAACCRHLIAADAQVVVADINAAAGKSLADELGDGARFVQTDVASESSVQAAVDLAVSTFGGLHGAVACAGVLDAGRVVSRDGPHNLDRFRRVIEVNLIGTFNLARLAAQAMMQNEPETDGERGLIVMTASVAAMEAQIGQASYAASKGGVASMTLPLARELGRHGIRVVSIAPGVFDTAMMAEVNDELRQSLEAQVPFPQRFGDPREYAALVGHIAENRMLNGTVLRLDGGLRMGPS